MSPSSSYPHRRAPGRPCLPVLRRPGTLAGMPGILDLGPWHWHCATCSGPPSGRRRPQARRSNQRRERLRPSPPTAAGPAIASG